ncbi:hypothetical protein ACFL0C_01905, partial [Patescibacteria group bacterium]
NYILGLFFRKSSVNNVELDTKNTSVDILPINLDTRGIIAYETQNVTSSKINVMGFDKRSVFEIQSNTETNLADMVNVMTQEGIIKETAKIWSGNDFPVLIPVTKR